MEGKEEIQRNCRLLVGMQKLPMDIIRDEFAHDHSLAIDNQEANKIRKRLAQEFRDQLTIGIPTDQDEKALRKLSEQMKAGILLLEDWDY